MKAFLLAAGYGERLRPLTDRIPKPLAPVMNVPSICYALTLLKEAGVTEIVCNLHHLGDAVEAFFRAHDNFGLSIAFSREKEILGTGGGLENCRAYFTEGPFVYLNSDMIADIDLRAVIRAHESSGAFGTLVLAPAGPGGGRVTVQDGRVVNLRNILPDGTRPEHDFLGAAVLSPGIFPFLKEGFSDIVVNGFIDLAKDGSLGYYTHTDSWHDIGSIDSYRLANMSLLDMPDSCKKRIRGATGLCPAAVAAGVRIGAGAVIERSVIGEGCVIGDGARIEESVLLDGVSLQAGSDAIRMVRWM